jgi:hypothetical protein
MQYVKPTLIKLSKDNNIAIDYTLCPHCFSQAVRNKMDNPYTIYGRSYNCHNCGAEIIVSPPTEEESY